MKIHSICVVKNEGDIIELCLDKALEWSDFIYVYDNGSDDDTWKKVQARQSARVIPWKCDDKVFQDSLRAEVFNAFKERANHGDWWCRLDADEFYVQDPRRFLATVPKSMHVVWGLMIEYYLTNFDIDAIDFKAAIDVFLPQINHYTIQNSEPRFFRHRNRLQWPPTIAWPLHMGLAHPERILLKHYKYRSPAQIQRRLDTRRTSRERGSTGFDHWVGQSWREKLADPTKTEIDAGNGDYVINWNALPNHMESRFTRILKKIMHGLSIWP
jgi:hypothetical protein